jgi:hypothetical protein
MRPVNKNAFKSGKGFLKTSNPRRNNLQELFEHGRGETPDSIAFIVNAKEGSCAPLPGPVPELKDAGGEEKTERDFDYPIDLAGVYPQWMPRRDKTHIGGHQVVMDGDEIIEHPQDLHILGRYPHLFGCLTQGGPEGVNVFRMANPARERYLPPVVSQVFSPLGEEDMVIAVFQEEGDEHRGGHRSGRQRYPFVESQCSFYAFY